MSIAPVQHLEESQKLTADALVDLFEVRLKHLPIIYRFHDGPEVEWQDALWEQMACQITGVTRSAEGEESRPYLKVMNPFGIFNEVIINNDLDQAIVLRKRVLRRNLEANVNKFEQRMWQVSRVKELISGQSVTLELRNMTEGANFQIPVRMYTPPDFPFVTL